MANFPTTWRTVEQLEEVKASKKGNPQRRIRTDQGWVTCRGKINLYVGDKIELQGLNEFSNPNTGNSAWYAEVVDISREKPATPPLQQQPSTPQQETKPAPTPSGTAYRAEFIRTEKIPWADFELAFNRLVELANEAEPNRQSGATGDWAICSEARAAIINTGIIAFSQGRIEAPLPGPEVKVQDDDIPF